MSNKRKHDKVRVEELTPRSNTPNQSRIIQTSAQMYSGPLPRPEDLAKFEAIQPGLADRIVKMAESEAVHRRSLEEKALDCEVQNCKSQFIEARIGQIFALIIGLFCIGVGGYCGLNGAQLTGGLIGAGGVGALVTAFILGRYKNKSSDAKAG